jgi:hypothetical protein
MGKNILFSNRGETLIMALVTAIITSILVLVMADLMNLSVKSSNVASNTSDFELLAQDINITTRSVGSCAGFAKDANGNKVVAPAGAVGLGVLPAAPPADIPVDRLFRGNDEMVRVGQRISAGTTVSDIRFLGTTLPDEDVPVSPLPGGPYLIRHMRLQVTLQRPADAFGNKNPVKIFPIRVYLPQAGGAIESCEKVKDPNEDINEGGEVNISTATGKVDWSKTTTWASKSGDAKYLGMSTWSCQSSQGTGQCAVFNNNGVSQQGITVNCADGKAGLTVFRGSQRQNHNIQENYTTYCSFDPNSISITPPAVPKPIDPVNFIDGDVAAMCTANPADPMCVALVAENAAIQACNSNLPDQQAYDACVAAVPPAVQIPVGGFTVNAGGGGGGNNGSGM